MYHILAILTVLVWGTTFVSTKVLLEKGLTPSDIFLLRFTIAYLGMALICHKQWLCNNWRDELIMLLAGVSGGSLYFIGENTGLLFTQAGNVSLLVCMAPLLTVLFAKLKDKEEKTDWKLWLGSLIALLGVAFVVQDDGGMNTHPLLGNGLALLAAACWAIYQIIVKPISHDYGINMLTRKIFGYGLITIIPYWLYTAPNNDAIHFIPLLKDTVVLGNIFFLGFVASLLGYWAWNIIVQKLGAVTSSNYIYLNPLVTCIFSYFILGEAITGEMILGGLGIIIGIYVAIGLPKKKEGSTNC